jgi:predicted permease
MIIAEALTMLKALVAPLSMVVIGLRLADMNFKGIFTDKYMYLFLALRHIVLPLAVVGVVKLCELFFTVSHEAGMVAVILASAPAATSATMFAEMYDCDANYVSRIVTVSTLLSIATMPLMLLLM